MGKAATEYETPIMASGTACRLNAKVNTAIEPGAKKDAIAVSTRSENCPIESASVRGTDSLSTSFIYPEASRIGMAAERSEKKNGTCKARCMAAPNTTPHASPGRPIRGYRTAMPKIIPRL